MGSGNFLIAGEIWGRMWKGGDRMIRPIKECEIELCVSVIRDSFLTVAQEYGFTEENAPRFTAFATTKERLYGKSN